MLGNKKVFLEAFIIALVIFLIGILIGISFEKSRVDRLESFYFDLETDIFDFQISSKIIYEDNLDCDTLKSKAISFAEEIYAEAIKLEKYDNSNKLTPEVISLHRRYDLLRTILWEDLIQAKKICGNQSLNTIIYLYKYDKPSLTLKGTQGTMSNYLIELKEKYEDEIILIPIAFDTGIQSLEILKEKYGLEDEPSILVNEEFKLTDLNLLAEIEKHLN